MSEKQIKYLNVDDLLLDDENPRLPQDISSEVDILEFICTNYAVEELVEAIGENGYFAGEPLIVIKNPNGDNNYIVVEGNRRLSALKVLNNPELYPDENLKKLAKDAKTSPSSIPSVIFANRNEVANYLGLRHITGVKSWGPLSKARYLKQIFDKTSEHGTLEVRLNSVAKSVGSRSDYIRRNLTTLAVYNLIKEKDYFGIENMDDKNFHHFSVFQSALSKPPIRNYLAVPDSYKLDLEDDLNVDNLKFLTKIIVEKKENGKTTLGFPKNLNKLAEIIEDVEALSNLKKTWNLDEAYKLTTSISLEFLDHVLSAKYNLAEAIEILYELRRIENPKEVKDALFTISNRVKAIENRLSEED